MNIKLIQAQYSDSQTIGIISKEKLNVLRQIEKGNLEIADKINTDRAGEVDSGSYLLDTENDHANNNSILNTLTLSGKFANASFEPVTKLF